MKKKEVLKTQRFWVLFCFCALCNALSAENSEMLMIEFVDGTNVQLELADTPLVSFSDAFMVVQSKKVTAEYEQEKVAGFRFVPIPTQIKENLRANSIYVQYVNRENVKIIGAKGMAIRIYKIDGTNVVSQKVDSDEFAVSLCALTEDVYILKLSNGLQFKYYKK